MVIEDLSGVDRFRTAGVDGSVRGGEHRHDLERIGEFDWLGSVEESDDFAQEHGVERDFPGELDQLFFRLVVADQSAVTVDIFREFHNAAPSIGVNHMADVSAPIPAGSD